MKEAAETFGFRTFLFADGTKSLDLVAAVGADTLEGLVGTAPGLPAGPAHAAFVRQYRAAYGDKPPLPFIENAYDALAVIEVWRFAAGGIEPLFTRDAQQPYCDYTPAATATPYVPGLIVGVDVLSPEGHRPDYGVHIRFTGGIGAVARYLQRVQQRDRRYSLIHGVATDREDYAVMPESDVTLVWSPRSNLALYGQTVDIAGALEEGVRVALSTDWSPSGSFTMREEVPARAGWRRRPGWRCRASCCGAWPPATAPTRWDWKSGSGRSSPA